MRSCPACGADTKPDDKFCGDCGAPLGPPLAADTDGQSHQPAPEVNGGTHPSHRLIVAVLLFALALIIIAGIYFLFTGSGIGGNPATTSPASGTGNMSGNSQNGSYVIVENEEPLLTATTPVPATSVIPVGITTITTALTATKPVVCAADRRNCGNQCIDVRYNSDHCGYCNNTCPSGQSCMNGQCQVACSLGKASCIDGCYDLLTDPDHCGSCLNNCPAGLLCRYGQCTAPDTPMAIPA